MTPQELQQLLKDNPHVQIVRTNKQPMGTQSLPASRPDAHSNDPKAEWTKTERKFAREVLQPRVDEGNYAWFVAQVPIFMPGQRYTMDFVAALWDGSIHYYEVKGAYKLGSEGRASVKLRWLTSHLQQKHGHNHKVFKADWRSKRNQPKQWHITEIKIKTAVHPLAKGKR